MKITHLSSKRLWFIASVLVLDVLFFFYTNPSNINSSLLIVGFILLSLTFYGTIELLLYLLSNAGIHFKYRRKLAAFLAIIFCVLIALQSIGQLTFRDVLVIVPLGIMFYIYYVYIKPRSRV